MESMFTSWFTSLSRQSIAGTDNQTATKYTKTNHTTNTLTTVKKNTQETHKK